MAFGKEVHVFRRHENNSLERRNVSHSAMLVMIFPQQTLRLQIHHDRYGTRPTNDISIEFEIQWNFVMLLFITYSTDHNDILHTSPQ